MRTDKAVYIKFGELTREEAVNLDEPVVQSPIHQPPLQLLDEIREKLWTFSVAVFGVDGARPVYRGTATCVAAGGVSYLLTAAYVWKALQGDCFALSLEADRLLIPIQRDFVEARLLSGSGPAEWGPDLALIRLPDLIASDVRQLKAFYDLDRRRPESAVVPDQHDLWAAIGAPAEQSRFEPKEAVLRLTLFDSWTAQVCERDGFDYFDVAFDHERRPNLPRSYGGISGSGLWQIPITTSANGWISWKRSVRLGGVAFFQKPTSGQQDLIRCHGSKSILRAVAEQRGAADR